MTIEHPPLCEKWLAMMAAESLRDYSAEPGVEARVGKIFADLENERAIIRRDYMALSGAIH